jgi:Ni,Fe-hydrogenase III large subunit
VSRRRESSAASAFARLRMGVLPELVARSLGAEGIVGRASGLDLDARRDRPYSGYRDLASLKVFGDSQGDALARTRLRLLEMKESLRLFSEALSELPSGAAAVELGPLPPNRAGIGYAEGPRGQVVTYLLTGEGGVVRRYRVRAGSYFNWPALPSAFLGEVVGDFPLVERSFGLCAACTER